MLEVVETQSGYFVPKLKGYFLASSRNPEAESIKWLERNIDFISEQNFVLGLGAGFHIKLLAETFPKNEFHVFDFNDELYKNCYLKYFNSYKNVHVHILNQAEDVLRMAVFEVAVHQKPRVLQMLSACQAYSDEFAQLKRLLTFRHRKSLEQAALFLKLGSLHEAMQKSEFESLSIKTISHDFEKSDKMNQEKKAWLFLRELVK